MPGLSRNLQGLLRAAGPFKAFEILARRALRLPGAVRLSVAGHALEVRPRDSDLFVLGQIFGWKEYQLEPARLKFLRDTAARWIAEGATPLIVDAGANVGYSSLYFADLFPGARVVAVEPDPSTFDILQRHVASTPAIEAVHAALWSHERGLQLQKSEVGSWGNAVSEGSGTPSRRLDTLVAGVPNARPLIVKLDIEGAEREVVESCPDVFARTKCIMVEPHDFMNSGAACLSPLYQVAGRLKFDTLLNGENLLLLATE